MKVRSHINGQRRSARHRWVVLLAVTVLAAGCASDDSSSSQPEPGAKEAIYVSGLVNVSDDGQPEDGGTLTVAESGEPTSLDPTVTYANAAVGGSALAAVYDTLMTYDVETGSVEPRMAESLETDDHKTWTITLRDGVTFTDGTSVDADAVLASFQRYLDEKAYQAALVSGLLKSMTAPDDRTVVVSLNSPWPGLANQLAGGLGMIVAPASYADPEKFEPIGAGPFTYQRYSPSEELLLTANKDYWNGAPHLEQLRMMWPGTDAARRDSLDNGDVDVAFLREAKTVEAARTAGRPGFMSTYGLGTLLWVNNREGRPGADVRVRQAMNLAIDPKVYVGRLNQGDYGLPTKALLPDSSAWKTDVEQVEVDLDAAKKLVEAAKADGFDGKISLVGGNDPVATAGAVTLTGMLEQVGFTVEYKAQRTISEQVKTIYADHAFDLAVAGNNMSDEDPYARLSGALSSNAPTNPSGFANATMDELLAELREAASPEEGKPVLAKIEKLWQEEVPGIPLAATGIFLTWSEDVHGIVPTAEGLVHYDQAWLAQ
ncbi:ABC transporter substrate-binding protein [Nocardioides alcanivorans]|uniref:ABC transporter substrate-binding protein n=1 Tax=Nocardioides alcanivorans TaxID=2897352 RepID=UPI001F3C4627|nr:ABC transporter substrate-binding protein [Nocardioides alcanivorans]